MAINGELKMEKYKMKLIEKQQKYQPYSQVKLISMNFLQAKKCCPLVKKE